MSLNQLFAWWFIVIFFLAYPPLFFFFIPVILIILLMSFLLLLLFSIKSGYKNYKAKKEEKKNKLASLMRERDELRIRLQQRIPEQLPDLINQRNELISKGCEIKDMEGLFEGTIKHLLEITEVYCRKCVHLSTETECSEGDYHKLKDFYSAYGLLISACIKSVAPFVLEKENRELTKLILTKIQSTDEYKFIEGVPSAENFAKTSLELTHSMLILLPPLLLIQPQLQDDDIQDTNRLTWNEEQRERPLIYYRPVMVFGNQLNVASRGLVGNSDTCIDTANKLV